MEAVSAGISRPDVAKRASRRQTGAVFVGAWLLAPLPGSAIWKPAFSGGLVSVRSSSFVVRHRCTAFGAVVSGLAAAKWRYSTLPHDRIQKSGRRQELPV